MMAYSFLLSIYKKESPEYLRVALDSVLAQTVFPNEVVMVKDGSLTDELEAVLSEYDSDYPGLFKFISYPENRGLGYALSKGVPACSNELIARMDTDDYSFPDRMERQLAEFEADPELDMLGTQVYEFIESPDKPISVSELPLEGEKLMRYSKRRNPFRHTPMVYKKSKVLEAGNYSSGFLYFEDWDLFSRMLAHGDKGRNLNAPLVAVRTSQDFFARRGGAAYLPHIWKFKTEQLKRGYFTPIDFIMSFVPHAAVCLMPNKLRSYVYNKMLRGSLND